MQSLNTHTAGCQYTVTSVPPYVPEGVRTEMPTSLSVSFLVI